MFNDECVMVNEQIGLVSKWALNQPILGKHKAQHSSLSIKKLRIHH
jgi:hypothetical protein